MLPVDPIDHAVALGIYFGILAVSAALILWLTTVLMRRLTHGINEVDEIARKANIAVALVRATFFGVISIVVWKALSPLMTSWANAIYIGIDLRAIGMFVLRFIVFLGAALAFSFVAILSSVRIFTWLTKDVDEWEEIRKGNVAIAITLTVLTVTVGYFISDFVSYLMIFLTTVFADL